MTDKKTCIFTHLDLDGVVSYLTITWFYPNIPFEIVPVRSAYEFRQIYLNWCLNHKPDEYERIYILDLDVSGNEDLVDNSNFIIIDHHSTHEKTEYKHAKAFVKKYTSACKLIYKILSAKFPSTQLTPQQKTLIALTDDYDSYTLKSPLSKNLNTVYWSLTDNFNTFCKIFKRGFFGFSIQQQSMIKIYQDSLNTYYNNINEIYVGEICIDDKSYKVCSLLADKYINDLSDIFFISEQADVVILYNHKLNKVYIRRNKSCDLNVGKLCESWGGGGHEAAGGCPASEGFIEMSKSLKAKPLNNM